MFGLGKVLDSVTETASDFCSDPIGTSVDIALAPVRDTADILEGLTEGEIRTLAIARLGADVVAGMAMSEIIEALTEE